MPPSGYSGEQTSDITAFLRSCSAALRDEARALNASPLSALTAECENICVILDADEQLTPVSRGVLQLTLAFYQSVARVAPEDWDAFEAAVSDALDEASDAIRAVHVPAHVRPEVFHRTA